MKYLIRVIAISMIIGIAAVQFSGCVNREYVDAAKNDEKKKTITLSKSDVNYTLDFGSNTRAVQNFVVYEENKQQYVYTTQKYSSNDNSEDSYVKISKFKIEGKTAKKLKDEMWIKDAGHGQTLEVYRAKDENGNLQTYLLFALKDYTSYEDKGDKNHWSTQIGRIEFFPCNKKAAKEYKDFKRFTNLNYANNSHSNFGKVYRADASLSTAGKAILIWKQNTNKKNEFTAYNLEKFNEKLNKANNSVSFQNIKYGELGGEFSFNDKNNNRGIPTSIQGIEMSNESNNKRSIYISSGDEGFDNRPLKIYRFNSQGEKNPKRE